MEWYNYFSCFWAGMFIGNTIPHLVNGVSGNRFPTPFAKPPGRGLSSPVVNVIWALVNFLIGYVLYRAGKLSSQDNLSLILVFVGFALINLMSAINFAKKDKM